MTSPSDSKVDNAAKAQRKETINALRVTAENIDEQLRKMAGLITSIMTDKEFLSDAPNTFAFLAEGTCVDNFTDALAVALTISLTIKVDSGEVSLAHLEEVTLDRLSKKKLTK